MSVSASVSAPTSSATTTSASIVSARIGAVAGMISAVILIVNVLKIVGVLPTVTATQLVAPAGQGLAIVFVLGLAAVGLPGLRPWAQLATALNVLGLTAGVGVEYVLNFVLRDLPPAVRDDVLAGPLGIALPLTLVLFVVGSLASAVVLWITRSAPRPLTAAYAISAVGVGLRPALPEPLFLAALVALALCIAGFSIWMLSRRAD